MIPQHIAVVSAGLRTPSSTGRLADILGEAAGHALASAGHPVEITRVELRDLAHEITDALLTGSPGPRVQGANALITAADAVVAVTPTFSASYSGLLKLYLDVLERDSLRGTPVLMAATGGTERHALMLDHAMRPLFAALGAVSVPTAVYAVASDLGERGSSALAKRVDRAVRELARIVEAAPRGHRSLHLVHEPPSTAASSPIWAGPTRQQPPMYAAPAPAHSRASRTS